MIMGLRAVYCLPFVVLLNTGCVPSGGEQGTEARPLGQSVVSQEEQTVAEARRLGLPGPELLLRRLELWHQATARKDVQTASELLFPGKVREEWEPVLQGESAMEKKEVTALSVLELRSETLAYYGVKDGVYMRISIIERKPDGSLWETILWELWGYRKRQWYWVGWAMCPESVRRVSESQPSRPALEQDQRR